MKIVSWNLEGRLSNLATGSRGNPEKIVAGIRTLNADVLVHPEAFGTDPAVAPLIEAALTRMGYESISVAYDDSIGRGEKAVVPGPHLRVMSRLPILEHEFIRPGGLRSMIAVTVREPETNRELRVIAVHLDDRSEAYRMQQIGPMIEYINGSAVPTIMMGDFNAMPPNTIKSRLIHSAIFRRLASLVVPHRHVRYVLTRLGEMASGTTIASILQYTSLVNTDPAFKSTTTPKMRRMEWMPSIRFAKIDWIFVSPDLGYRDFAISRDLGSDHRALSAEIFFKTTGSTPENGVE